MDAHSMLSGLLTASTLVGDLNAVLDHVGTNAPKPAGFCFDETCLSDISTALVNQLYPFLGILATIFIVMAGIRLMSKSSEDELQNARRSIGMVAAGVILGVLARQGVLYDAVRLVQDGEGAAIVCEEFMGVISIFEGIAGILAIMMIVITGIRCLLSFGNEDTFANMRNVVVGVILGMFVLVSKEVVFPAIGLGASGCTLLDTISSSGIVNHVIGLVSVFLGYLVVLAILILVIIGLMIILYLGNEEQVSKLKGYLLRLAIGFIVLAMTKFIIDIVILGE